MAYRADIEIGVKGVRQLEQLRSEINKTSVAAQSLIEVVGARGRLVQNIENYQGLLNKAANSLSLVTAGTQAETKAVKEYVTILGQANAARERQQNLISTEIQTRRALASVDRIANAGPLGTKSQVSTRLEEFLRNKQSAQIARETNAAALAREQTLAGGQYGLNVLPAGKTLSPGGNTVAAQKQYRDLLNQTATIQNAVAAAAERTGRSQRQLEIAAIGTAKSTAQRVQISSVQNKLDEQSVAIAKARNLELAKELGIEVNIGKAAANNNKARGGGLGGAAKNAAGNAIIGGAFPLLFGQGAGAAVGGGLGGAAGGLLGGTFGFGLSLVGTAIGTAVDEAENFNKELVKLNTNVQGVGTSAASVDKLASSLGIAKDEAIKLLAQFSQFGSAKVRETLAATFGGGGEQVFQALEQVTKEKDVLNAIVQARTLIGNKKASDLLTQLKLNGATVSELGLQEALLRLKEKQIIADKTRVSLQDRILAGLATAGGGVYVDPSVFGKERGANQQKQFDKDRKERLKILQDSIRESQKFFGQVNALNEQYDEQAKAADKAKAAADAENRILRSVASIRKDTLSTVLEGVNAQFELDTLYKGEYVVLKDRIKNAQNELDLKTLILDKEEEAALASVTDAREQAAILKLFDQKVKLLQTQATIQNVINTNRAAELKYAKDSLTLQQQGSVKQAASGALLDITQAQGALSRAKGGTGFEQAQAELAIQQNLQLDQLAQKLANINLLKQQAQDTVGKDAKNLNNLIATETALYNIENERLNILFALQEEQLRLNQVTEQYGGIANAVGTAFSTSFKGIIDGSMTAREALAGFFQSVADAFLDMAAQIIAKWITMTILNSVLQLFPGGGGKGLSNLSAPASINNPLGDLSGIGVSYRAAGGPVTGGMPYIVGEKGPELFMPGRSGTVIPNNALGGGTTNVVVNVDASGNSSVQGDQQQAKQLGVAVSAAVQAELIKHQRPGGLLAGTRR